MRDEIAVVAPAKLNLSLEVVRRLANGYHEIRSVFVRVPGLADTITLRIEHAGSGISLSSTSDSIPCNADNLCHRAASRYLEAIGRSATLHIHIEKRIPVAAGLGGGSSDGAAVLLALNRLHAHALAPDALARLGADIGKDLPFFLSEAAAAHVSGMGEIIAPVSAVPILRFLIVNPGVAVSTAQAYAALDAGLAFMDDGHRVDASRVMMRALASQDVHAIAAALYNDFEPVIEREHPVIKGVKQSLRAFGALGALMSGSGSTVFGLFDAPEGVQEALRAIQRHHPRCFVAAA